jgi:sigma-E factor negative regulatory protein RseB
MLERMATSFRSLNYRGMLTYQQGQQISSVRIEHVVVDGKEQARVVHLDGDEREILRRGHAVQCAHVGNRVLGFDAGHPEAPTLSGAEVQSVVPLPSYYAVEHDGEERVAGRVGSRLRVSPRDPYRYGMTLVLDQATSLLLKSETMDGAGRVLERFQFVAVEIGDEANAAALHPETADPSILDVQEKDGMHGAAVAPDSERKFDWTVSWLPEGFALASREVRGIGGDSAAVEMQMYTDGLAVFSIFVEKLDQSDSAPAGHASQGATVAYMTERGPDNLVTVVGEIPIATAQLVANAVNFPAAGL